MPTKALTGLTREDWKSQDLPPEVRSDRLTQARNKDEFGLTPQQRCYCDLHYLEGLSKKDAYYAAGYKGDPKNITQAICRLEGQKAVKRFKFSTQKIMAENLGASDQEIIRALVYTGLKADATSIFDQSENGTLTVKDFNDIPKETRQSISKIKIQNGKFGPNIEITMHDRVAALRQLADLMGLNSDINKAIQAFRHNGYEVKRSENGFEIIDLQNPDTRVAETTIDVDAEDEEELIKQVVALY